MSNDTISYIQDLLSQNTAFMLFKKAGNNQLTCIVQKNDELYHHAPQNIPHAVFNYFNKEQQPVIIYGHITQEFTLSLPNQPLTHAANSLTTVDKHNHQQLVDKGIKAIEHTDLRKVVLSRHYRFSHQEDLATLYYKMMQAYPDANVYFMHHPKIASWMGATPELLLHIKDDQLTTMSLAGTAVYDKNIKHRWQPKEQDEQQIVTQYIADQLTKMNCEQVVIHPQTTIRAGQLIHLQTIITAQKTNQSTIDVLNLLHPTPAVCGFPTQLAYDFILNNENYDREFYTGYFGIVDPAKQEQSYYVNLRSMKVSDHHAVLYAGGGITIDSDPTKEYLETQAKLNTMYSLFNQPK